MGAQLGARKRQMNFGVCVLGTRVLIVALVTAIAGCETAPTPKPLPPAPLPPPAVPARLPSIFFGTNVVDLTPAQRQQVRELAVMLKQSHAVGLPIRVEGHSDRLGGRASKTRVSHLRAKAVANEFIFNGISPERITVAGHGDSQPAAPDSRADGSENPEGLALNRRVEIVIERTIK